MDKVSPFSFINEITFGKRNILNDDTKGQYIPFIINRGLSYYLDCVLYANDLNMFADMPKSSQYGFLLNSVSKRRRFSKWTKKLDNESISVISDIYECNERKAAEILSVLTPDQLKSLHALKTGSNHERRRN